MPKAFTKPPQPLTAEEFVAFLPQLQHFIFGTGLDAANLAGELEMGPLLDRVQSLKTNLEHVDLDLRSLINHHYKKEKVDGSVAR